MPPETKSPYSVFMHGNPVHDIPDFVGDGEAYEQYIERCLFGPFNYFDCEAEVTFKWDKWVFMEITGLLDWVYTYCPDRKVARLMRYGKNKKIRHKNFYRAIRLLGEIGCGGDR